MHIGNARFCVFTLCGLLALGGCTPKASSEEHGKAPSAMPAATASSGKQAARPHANSRHERLARADPVAPAEAAVCADCGVVTAVREFDQEGKGSGLGVIAGGLTGAIVGNQVGNGSGRDLATIAGAVGGAFAGNKIEEKVKKSRVYEVTVRMDDGAERVLRLKSAPGVMAGDKVRVDGEHLVRR